MKKVIALAACLLTLTATVNAQEVAKTTTETKTRGAKTAEERAQKQTNDLHATVNLTEDQKTKVYNLTLNKVKKADEIKTKHRGDKAAADKELSAVRKEYRENVKALLTAEQIEKYKAKHGGDNAGE